LLEHLIVPESEQTKSFRSDATVTMFIVRMTIHVLSAIELDHELRFLTAKSAT
jgi:hypothetical protein